MQIIVWQFNKKKQNDKQIPGSCQRAQKAVEYQIDGDNSC